MCRFVYMYGVIEYNVNKQDMKIEYLALVI